MGYSRGGFGGGLASDRAACKFQRMVYLKKIRTGPDRTVGTDRSDNEGLWRVRVRNAKGRYYAKVKVLFFPANGTTEKCKPGRSITIRR